MNRLSALLCLGVFIFSASMAAQEATIKKPEVEKKSEASSREMTEFMDKLRIGGYAAMNYYAYDFDTYKAKNEIDLERVIVELRAEITPKIEFEVEIEFEGGGAGTALELERFEEFGEFEVETEHGGEIILEEINLTYNFDAGYQLVVGQQIVQVGQVNRRHRPFDYRTNARPELETTLIPTAWSAVGLGLFGRLDSPLGPDGSLAYSAQLVQGLDSTRFSSARFVADGQDKPFERAVVEDFALALAGTYHHTLSEDSSFEISLSGYLGNSSGNRPKDDLALDANVAILEGFAALEHQALRFEAQSIFGIIQNSDKVTLANKNLSNALGAPRTAVAREAFGWALQIQYDLFRDLFPTEGQRLTPYLRYEVYDTMHRTVGGVFDNPRYEREVVTIGVNWRSFGHVVTKISYSMRTLGNTTGGKQENTLALGFGVTF